jgi:hypothetical protein
MLLWQLGIITGKKQQCDPFPKIDRRQQGRLENRNVFTFHNPWKWKWKHISIASLDLGTMVVGNAGGGWTCYESGLFPDPAQAKLQTKDFWHCKRNSCKFWEGRGGQYFLVIHISPTPLFQRRLSCRPRLFGVASAAVVHAGRGGGCP